MKITLLFCLTFLVGQPIFAGHLLGGHMRYECLSEGEYRITMTVFRDGNCTNCASFDNPAMIGIYRCAANENCEGLSQQDAFIARPVGPLRIDTLQNNSFNCMDGTQLFSANIQIATYEFELNLPVETDFKYVISYQRCCRDNKITNIKEPSSQGFTISTELSPSAQQLCNNSPLLALDPIQPACIGELTQLDFSASDADSDSLVYTVCSPLQGGGAILSGPAYSSCGGVQPDPSCPPPFQDIQFLLPTFSELNPIGVAGSYEIDPQGILEFIPSLLGVNVAAICIDEYRSGQLLSHSRYEFQIYSGVSVNSTLDLELSDQVRLFPNPTNHSLKVELPETFQPKNWTVMNLRGQAVLENYWNTDVLEVSQLVEGVYFLFLKNEEKILTKRFVVQK